METEEDIIGLPSVTPEKVKERQAEDIAEFKKKSERLLSSIPKKHRVERARALEEIHSQEQILLARLTKELEELGISTTDETGETLSSLALLNEAPLVGELMKKEEPRAESKAARRRRKKAEKEAEEQRRIANEKAKMGPTPKQMEMKAIDMQLTPQNLRIHPVPADGHCLYSSIAHQMTRTGMKSNVSATVEDLRAATAAHMMQRKEEYIPFIDSIDGDEGKFVAYCEQLRSEAVWGGQVELKAIAELLGATIEVYAADMPLVKMGDPDRSSEIFRVSFHQKYYGLGEHYNSVVPKSTN
ncbi:OTU domain-containing protein 6B [Gracilariopsis chorda]|uniref:OTU domain-containing protein 6B n=1 Tax=Gracilariopsis chorda TaxID=448386 RepID=A0A2V3J279_9FLOR|nr:OTU domain-containing protein 6B [Gracilariopsis chorda]|eukprot:PXF48202.1 OTU domain-containing protein 6B [Gracilariopsis chorda]